MADEEEGLDDGLEGEGEEGEAEEQEEQEAGDEEAAPAEGEKATEDAAAKADGPSKVEEATKGGNSSKGGSSQKTPLYETLGLTPAQIRRMEPQEVFRLFDTDGSGLISFSEFKELLLALKLEIPDAKALRFFRICDKDNSGEIDFQEFQTVLYATDPEGGNPTGYQPSSIVGPRDVFDMFDEDRSGEMDEDEFYYALDYLGIKVSDQKLEKLFNQFDEDESGFIDYTEFKQCWLLTCDLNQELEDRGIDVPKFASKAWKMRMLDDLTHEEETKELLSIAEAVRWRKWQDSIEEKRKGLVMLERRALLELQKALDAAGQVYVIGSGTANQFASNPRRLLQTAHFSMEGFDHVTRAWQQRLKPGKFLPVQSKRPRDGEGLTNLEYILKFEIEDPYVEAAKSPFNDRAVAFNTCALWGRRVREVAVCESVVFCLSDLGEVYGLGGRDLWWWKIEHDSVWMKEWRGDSTERSRLLLTTMNIKRNLDSSQGEDGGGEEPAKQQQQSQEAGMGQAAEDEEDVDALAEMYKTMAMYYDVWKPPRGDQQSRLLQLRKDIIPKIRFDDLRLSLELRCYQDRNLGKQAMMEVLYKDFALENRTLGEKAHRRMKELEQQIRDLKAKKKMSLVAEIKALIQKEWRPLRDTRVEEDLQDSFNMDNKRYKDFVASEERYKKFRKHIYKARQDMNKSFTPRGMGLDIKVPGITARGAPLATPRGYETAMHVAAGANHVCLVHQSGQLYTWGLGAAGRLGHDFGEDANPREDCAHPTLVVGLLGKPVARTACGFSHTLALTTTGDVYAWGSAVTGKLGLGPIDELEEAYCSVPTRVLMDKNVRVKRVSCGASHSAAITLDGSLYVWGCGDGGRLGLGAHDMTTHYTPTRVTVAGLDQEKVGSVSCGNAHTVVSTALIETYQGGGDERVKVLTGGRVLVAGSPTVLGGFYPTFTTVQSLLDLGVSVHMVSAGHLHSAVLTTDGALYAWGYNHSGCCGQPLVEQFIPEPKCIRFLYDAPSNLALGKRVTQSSTMGPGKPELAVDGRLLPTKPSACTCTKGDQNSWWTVDLGDYCTVSWIRVFNRADEADGQDPLKYMKRLFPCWIICSREPFDESLYGEESLEQAMGVAVVKKRFVDLQRKVIWRLPERKLVRYVRIQLEQQNFLTLAQVEVFGNVGLPNSVGRVTHFQCGRNVTVAVVGPSTKPEEVHLAYKRAIQADSYSADILRQYETFIPEYDKVGRGEALDTCAICRGGYSCERCMLRMKYKEELTGMPLGPGGRLRRLKSIKDFLTVSGQPPLEFQEPERYKKKTFGDKLKSIFWMSRNGTEDDEADGRQDPTVKSMFKSFTALKLDFAKATPSAV